MGRLYLHLYWASLIWPFQSLELGCVGSPNTMQRKLHITPSAQKSEKKTSYADRLSLWIMVPPKSLFDRGSIVCCERINIPEGEEERNENKINNYSKYQDLSFEACKN